MNFEIACVIKMIMPNIRDCRGPMLIMLVESNGSVDLLSTAKLMTDVERIKVYYWTFFK